MNKQIIISILQQLALIQLLLLQTLNESENIEPKNYYQKINELESRLTKIKQE